MNLDFAKSKKICPHSYCGKVFYVPIFKQGILFCPHCEKSLLNFDKSHISRMLLYVQKNPNSQFYQFLLTDISHYFLRYFAILALFLVVSLTFVFMRFYTMPTTDMIKIGVCAVLFFMLILFIFSMYCDGKSNKSDKGSQNPLRIFSRRKFTAGVDKLAEVTNGIGINMTLSHLKTGATTANIMCQHCQSQRLIKYIFLGKLQKNYQTNLIFGTVFQHIDLDKFEFKSQVLCLKCETLFEENRKSSKESMWEAVFMSFGLPFITLFGDYMYDKNSIEQTFIFIFLVLIFAWMVSKFFRSCIHKVKFLNICPI